MKNILKTFALVISIVVLFYGCEGNNAEVSNTNKYGEELSLNELQGKVVILDFWATWCPPCRKGVPDLIELKEEYDQLEIVGISLDAISRGGATKDDVIPFIREFGINYPVVTGNQNVVMQYGGIQSIPTSFVIDRRGFVISRHIGLVPKETYKKDIEKALAGTYEREDYIKAPDFTLPAVQ